MVPCYRILMDLPTVFVYFEFKNAVSIFQEISRSYVPPVFLSLRRPETHKPMWEYCVPLQYFFLQSSSPFFDLLLVTSLLSEECTFFPQVCNLHSSRV